MYALKCLSLIFVMMLDFSVNIFSFGGYAPYLIGTTVNFLLHAVFFIRFSVFRCSSILLFHHRAYHPSINGAIKKPIAFGIVDSVMNVHPLMLSCILF